MNFKAVIFDLDGTLLDTLEDLSDSMNSVLESMSLPVHPLSDYKILVGRGMRNLVTSALPPEMRAEEIIEHCYTAMFEEYGRRWDKKTRPYEGIDLLLDTLSRKQIKAAILSNKIDELTQLVVKKYLGRWRFEAVFGERDGVPRKPDPAGLFEIAGIMNIPPAEILCLGDSGSDMTAAISAGMYPAGALWGLRGGEELISHGALKVFENPVDLLEIF
jgi:phosphoglycolate phosphatase